MFEIENEAQLEQLYGLPKPKVASKVRSVIDSNHESFIGESIFVVLATIGPTGIETSARGGTPGFVHTRDQNTLLLPDYSGNNRVDSLRNIVADPRVGLLFHAPDRRQILRVKGEAKISIDPDLTGRFQDRGQTPKSVLVINVTSCISQCGSAKIRAGMWSHPAKTSKSILAGLFQ